MTLSNPQTAVPMEESQLQNLTLDPSETVFSFPPHRRRPLRSRTYCTLIAILSHCHTDLPQLQMQVDSGDPELRSVREENGSANHNEINSVDVLVPHPNSKVSEDTLVQETTNGEKKGDFCFQDGAINLKCATEPKVDHINVVRDGEQEGGPAIKTSRNLSMVENQFGGCAAKEQENVNKVIDIQTVMDDFDMMEELEAHNIRDFPEVLDSCFGMDIIESSKAGEDGQENGIVLEENMPKEAEYELQLKEMELEKLIYADDEIEEGEISGEAEFADASFDALSECAVSLGDTNTKMVHPFEDSFDKEGFISIDEDRGHRRHETSDTTWVNVANNDFEYMKVENRTSTTAGKMQDFHSKNVIHDNHREVKKSGPKATCLENLTQPGRILQEIAVENQISATSQKDDDASKKKSKKCPLTKERRAKKKKKERLKRAEKNRKLGVKRLKLQPVLKPKKILYCRHYLQGRCHEGEKCNFSHDTVPLTKSTPCGHFARQSCMKGDDCPFDHQLSKYPCQKYTSNGFCSRGSDCLFSHEMPAKQSFSMAPNVSVPELPSAQHKVSDKGKSSVVSKVTKPDVKFPSPLNNLNTSEHTDAKLCFAGNSAGKSAKLLPTNPVPRPAGQAPRGISFLMNGGTSSADSTKHKQDGTSVRTTNGVDVGFRTTQLPGSLNKLNEMMEKLAPKKPRGINFLSFALPSSDVSSSKIFSNLPLNSNGETGISVRNDRNEDKLTCSLPESDGILKVNRQMTQSAKNLSQELNQNFNGSPVTAHLSSDKTRLGDSIFKGSAEFHFNKGDTALSFVKEKQSMANKLQDTVQMPSLSFDGYRGPSKGGQNAIFSSSFKTSLLSNTPSSVQKVIQSTLAFAEKFEPDIKVGSSLHRKDYAFEDVVHT